MRSIKNWNKKQQLNSEICTRGLNVLNANVVVAWTLVKGLGFVLKTSESSPYQNRESRDVICHRVDGKFTRTYPKRDEQQ